MFGSRILPSLCAEKARGARVLAGCRTERCRTTEAGRGAGEYDAERVDRLPEDGYEAKAAEKEVTPKKIKDRLLAVLVEAVRLPKQKKGARRLYRAPSPLHLRVCYG
jgi:hypothetical protein